MDMRSLRVLPRGDIIVDRATEFSEDSRLIIEDASQVPGVESILRKRCRAHIRSLGAIKIQKTKKQTNKRMTINVNLIGNEKDSELLCYLNFILKEPLR